MLFSRRNRASSALAGSSAEFLRDEAAFEGGFEDGLTQPRRVRRLGVELLHRVVRGGEGFGDAAEDFAGFCGRW